MTRSDSAPSVSNARRAFMKAGGSLVVGFALGRAPSVAVAARANRQISLSKSVRSDQVDGFLSIDASGNVTVYSGKVDLGTGVLTAMAQIAAEELCVGLERVTVIEGDTGLTPDQGITFGSLSVQVGGMQIRQAAATARKALLTEAAKRLEVASEALVIREGIAAPRGGGAGLSYAELVGGNDFRLSLDADAPLKDPSDFTIVGRPVPRRDIPGKVYGTFTYMQDVKRPSMVHARVVRPKGIKAVLKDFDDSACRDISGFVRTVRLGNFLAVVAGDEWASIRASRAIVARWSDWQGLPAKAHIWEHVRSTKVVRSEVLQRAGDIDAAFAGTGNKQLRSTFDFAPQTHGSIGPSCAIAEYRDGLLTCWTASQQTHLLRRQLARSMGIPVDDVRCIYVEGSGCYGRNGHEDAAADAALIARACGLPVRVQWMRHDEHGWDPKGPPTLLDFRGTFDQRNAAITAWESQVFVPERPPEISVALVAAELADLPHEPSHPGNVQQALAIPYVVPDVRVVEHSQADTPFRPSWIRSPGRMQNTFGNECFFDEFAIQLQVDPFQLRRAYLQDPRGHVVLDRLERLAAWQPRKAGAVRARSGRVVHGRGMAYVKYELVRTYVGVVCDVEVDRRTGAIAVKRFFVVHDCGQIINPDGLRNQIEGNIVQTVSRTLLEELDYDRSSVTSIDWATYPILCFPDVPDVVIELIDRPRERPWGAGEPTAAVVPAAVANAVFDATGIRLRSVPFRREKVLAALQARH